MKRFWSKVNKNAARSPKMRTKCWEWTASKKPDGNGQFMFGGRPVGAHRVAWMLAHGSLPVRLFHRCDNPGCVRPSHCSLEAEEIDHVARFHEKVNEDGPTMPGMDSPCWEWTAYRNPSGYGEIRWGDGASLAHRVAWELSNGAPPEGAFVCHHCDNPGCVRPSHMFIGDNAANMADCSAKGRMGRKLDSADVRRIRALRMDCPSRTYDSIGMEFGVSGAMVGYIVRGEWWRGIV